MTLSEFKAWFEGFTEGMDGPPGIKQWERIQARVKEISGTPTTYPVFVDRYIRERPLYDWHHIWNGPITATGRPATLSSFGMSSATCIAQNTAAVANASAPAFDSHAAMFVAGRADAEALAA